METFEYKTVTVDCKDMEHSQDKLTAQLNLSLIHICYRLCVCASGSVITETLNFST